MGLDVMLGCIHAADRGTTRHKKMGKHTCSVPWVQLQVII